MQLGNLLLGASFASRDLLFGVSAWLGQREIIASVGFGPVAVWAVYHRKRKTPTWA